MQRNKRLVEQTRELFGENVYALTQFIRTVQTHFHTDLLNLGRALAVTAYGGGAGEAAWLCLPQSGHALEMRHLSCAAIRNDIIHGSATPLIQHDKERYVVNW